MKKTTIRKYKHIKRLSSFLAICVILFGCISGGSPAFAKHPSYDAVATALLIRGINQDNIGIIQEAMKQGADVNALGSTGGSSKRGLTALMIVASLGDIDTANRLIKKGAWVNYRGNLDFTALIMACGRKGTIGMVRLLLDNGAKVNARNFNGDSALVWAASNGKTDIIRLLLARHANVNVRGQYAVGEGEWTLLMRSAPEVKPMLRAAGAR